ncbi:MAG: DegT/DnrJ/EryC1/StrS family aminotransferase [Sulfurovum sp.]|nr:DegT/DnrJ/EryC1/StrS family aminotransferase [Sulfurovum sp.]
MEYKGKNIGEYGDISTFSFHATKLFHTIEGGALIINDDSLVEKARYLINFGIANEESIPELGINAKMNEFEAAMGLCMLDEIAEVTRSRKSIYERYKEGLDTVVAIPKLNIHANQNYAYFPIILKDESQRIAVQKALNKHKIIPRRYFYPSLDTLSYIEPKQYMPNSRDISSRILALPMYVGLDVGEQTVVINTIRDVLKAFNG